MTSQLHPGVEGPAAARVLAGIDQVVHVSLHVIQGVTFVLLLGSAHITHPEASLREKHFLQSTSDIWIFPGVLRRHLRLHLWISRSNFWLFLYTTLNLLPLYLNLLLLYFVFGDDFFFLVIFMVSKEMSSQSDFGWEDSKTFPTLEIVVGLLVSLFSRNITESLVTVIAFYQVVGFDIR